MEKFNQLRYFLVLAVIVSALIITITKNFELMQVLVIASLSVGSCIALHVLIEVFITAAKPQYFNYNEDYFYNIKWTWNWNRNKEILNLAPFCTICNAPLHCVYDSLGNKTEYVCEICNKQIANINSSNRNFVPQFIKKSIIRKLKKENPLF